MRFAKKMARNLEKKANKGNTRAAKTYVKADKGITRSYADYRKWELLTRKKTLQNLSACFLYVMHIKYGFGKLRLHRLRDKMQSEMSAIVSKNVTVEEIAVFLHDDLKIDVGIKISDTKDRQRQIEERGVREMSAAFLMALLDEFNFKKKRLTDAYCYTCDLSDDIWQKKITYEEIGHQIEEVMK